jgi:DNA polymerase I
LYTKLKIIDNPKKTATKQNSTSEETLMKLLGKHPIIQKILDYRSLTKLKSTYVDTLPLMLNPRTGRIHTSYNQAVAATGRLSSNNPNLQNIPIRSERGREIRKAFIPRNDKYILLSADYSQIELRLIAEMSKDAAMLEAFRNGLDIHAATASRVFGIPVEQVNSDQRRKAKTVNFGIIYGISAFGLSERINIPRKEAAEIIDQYFKNFPAIKDYMNRTIDFARKNGYVETVFGRRRYIRDINSGNGVIRGFAERNAINAPLQGTAADIIKIAMIDIFRKFNEKKLQTRMIMQVHDELVFDVYKEELDTARQIISDKMRNALKISIPLEVDISTGKNWLDAH